MLAATRLFPLLLMLALAALTFWLELLLRDGEEPQQAPRRHDPDYIVERLLYTRFDARGATESTLAAERMQHYPDDDSTELLAPRLVQTRAHQPRVTVTAERAALSRDGEELFLYDNVLVVREAGAGRPETRMRTSFLQMARAQSVLRTDADIVITEGERVLSGRGMEYHNDSSRFSLRERVRGRYPPAKPNG
ncbi:MAG: LPS export ABC transporter periplasmic protein LptC [Burkholderiales bacterium]|nr:LPS export ABC transporter periplasmic protein LptC [Burkholderiales bacterium]